MSCYDNDIKKKIKLFEILLIEIINIHKKNVISYQELYTLSFSRCNL